MSKLSNFANQVLAAKPAPKSIKPANKAAPKSLTKRAPAARKAATKAIKPAKFVNQPDAKKTAMAKKALQKLKDILTHYKIKGSVSATGNVDVGITVTVRFSKTETTISKFESMVNQVAKMSRDLEIDLDDVTRGYFEFELEA